MMNTITQNQALQRWDMLSDALRDAIVSEANADFIWMTCTKEHLPEEKTSIVARLTGYVLLGFVHPEDMAQEISAQATLDPKIAAAIADAINQRIFSPLRPELEKMYNPPSKLENPARMQDIGPTIISETVSGGGLSVGATPLSFNDTKAAPAPQAPQKMPGGASGTGWSKTTPSAPVVKLSQTSTPPPEMPSAPKTPPPEARPQSAPQDQKSSMGEFERRAIQKTDGQAPAAPQKPSEPAPVIIHEDASFKPQQKTPDFHIASSPTSFDMQKPPAIPAPIKPAVIEFGGMKPPQPQPQTPKPPASTPRMVHYSEYRPTTPVPPAPQTPQMPQGPRQITEITGNAAPVPPVPPAPPAVPPAPKPPLPPGPGIAPNAPKPPEKIIYKDYSEGPKDKNDKK